MDHVNIPGHIPSSIALMGVMGTLGGAVTALLTQPQYAPLVSALVALLVALASWVTKRLTSKPGGLTDAEKSELAGVMHEAMVRAGQTLADRRGVKVPALPPARGTDPAPPRGAGGFAERGALASLAWLGFLVLLLVPLCTGCGAGGLQSAKGIAGAIYSAICGEAGQSIERVLLGSPMSSGGASDAGVILSQ